MSDKRTSFIATFASTGAKGASLSASALGRRGAALCQMAEAKLPVPPGFVLWYFAAFRTSTDCFEKRAKRGYLFTMGDELPPPERGLTADEINRTFGLKEQHGISQADMLKAAQEKFNVFHIVIEEGSYCRGRGAQTVANAWAKVLGKKVILLRNSDYLSQVILSVVQINEGANPDEVINSWQDDAVKAAVQHAVSLAG